MSKVLTDYVKPSFADDVIAALGNPKRGIMLSEYMKAGSSVFATARSTIRQARRFEVENDVTELAHHRSLQGWDTLLPDLERAIPPFDTMWVEWDESYRQELIRNSFENSDLPYGYVAPEIAAYDGDTAETIGYAITKLPMDSLVYSFQPYFRIKGDLQIIANPIGFAITPDSTLGSFLLLMKENHGRLLDKEAFRAYHLILKNINIFRYPETGALEQFADIHNLAIKSIQAAINAINTKILMFGGAIPSSMEHHPWDSCQLLIADSPTKDQPYSNMWLYYSDHDMDNAMKVWNRSSLWHTDFHSSLMNKEDYQDGDKSVAGDVRFLISLLAMVNYNWVEPMGQPRRSSVKSIAYGKRKANSVYYRLGITLPKEQIQMRLKDHRYSSPKREHEVRGHWRKLRSGKRSWIKPHRRGDASLGIITKDYVLMREHNQ